jgi:ferredoxin
VTAQRLRVDWPSCQARGLCHELLPEVIELDDWGYPVITSEITPELVPAARSAVQGCPRMALRLVE